MRDGTTAQPAGARIRAWAAAAALTAAAGGATAQVYPAKPVRFIVPIAAGGSSDVLARLVGGALAETWGQPVVVENRAGGGTIIGTEAVARAAADGYTLLLATSAYAVNFSLVDKLPYRATDLAAVTLLTQTPNVLAVHPSLPAKSLKDLLAMLRARPGQITYGSGGIGSSTHLAMELLRLTAKVDLVHVPYKGGGPALADLAGGQISLLFSNLPAAMPFVKAGKVRALAISSAQRSALLPEVPTVAEAALPGFEASNWNGLMAPAGVGRDLIARLQADFSKTLAQHRERLLANGFEPVGNLPAEFGAFVDAEIARWARVVKAAGIRPE